MSDPVTPLNGRSYSGSAEISEAPLKAMISLRGDHSDPKMARAVKAVTGAAVPEMRRVSHGTTGSAIWMSSDELLLITDYTQTDFSIATLETKLKGTHFMATNVSDARAVFVISGPAAREVLAKGAPIDLSSNGFSPGDVRRTRLGQLAAAIWMEEDNSFRLICFRSVAEFMFEWLKTAAEPSSLPEFLT